MSKMSLLAKRELRQTVREKYHAARQRKEKSKIPDGFVAATGYDRKYATSLLSKKNVQEKPAPRKISVKRQKYDQAVKLALETVWFAANQICAKRLIPFLPDLIDAFERHGGQVHIPINSVTDSNFRWAAIPITLGQ